MSQSNAYDPKAHEPDIYKKWIEQGAFKADPESAQEPYCIVIPPPNVTAPLHLGHALNNSIQDSLIRYHRMLGRAALWMPGTDHAGIATQTVVEKRLLKDEGKRRTDYSRKEFVARVQAWKDQYEARIIEQLQAMGASCDWDRTRFTMDEVCARAVRETFFRLFEDGLIYRGKRLVNWDPATQTVLADDEVEHEEVQGHFWYLRYPLETVVAVDGEDLTSVTVATTRPETMLGDAAVAMNPKDPRAKALVGQTLVLPIVGRRIPIIADDHVVMPDPEGDEKARFSTGFLKVTPAHDPDDYQIGLRHNLDQINVMAPDGSISSRYGWDDAKGAAEFLGLDRFAARKKIVAWFKQHDLLAEVRDYVHQVGHSYRSHVPIEPYLSDQWYVAVKKPVGTIEGSGTLAGTEVPRNSLAGLALEPVLAGQVRFVPERYAGTYRSWLENLRDWPISRQLWWGHQIPVWGGDVAETELADLNHALESCGERVSIQSSPHPEKAGKLQVFAALVETRGEAAAILHNHGFERDPDVLDTWFSSGLWPFSTMGWPESTPEFKKFYPGSVLCTAREIITLWVSRMVMLGRYCAGTIPFSDVFIHAMIQDGQGRKMSKSLGNGVDPLDVIDGYGTDAMRFTLISMTTQTQDVRMPVEPVELPDGRTINSSPKFALGRNFCNKLWNASRFVFGKLEGAPRWEQVDVRADLSDRWILSRLSQTVETTARAFESYRFNEAGDSIYHFVWDEFCDWYLEAAKSRIQAGDASPKVVLAYVLDQILRMLHPIAPFITEALWTSLNTAAPVRGPGNRTGEAMLMTAKWADRDGSVDEAAERDFDALREIVRSIRNIRTHHSAPPGKLLDCIFEAKGDQAEFIASHCAFLASQARLGEIQIGDSKPEEGSGAASVAIGDMHIHVLGVVDTEAERERLTKQREKLQKGIAASEGKLANRGFVSRAPETVVEEERRRLERYRAELTGVDKLLESLE